MLQTSCCVFVFVFCDKLHRNRNRIQYHRVIYLFLICVNFCEFSELLLQNNNGKCTVSGGEDCGPGGGGGGGGPGGEAGDGIVWYCTILYYTLLYCNILYCSVL